MPIRTFFRDTMELHRKMQDICSSLEVEYDPDEMTRLSGELIKVLLPHVETEDDVLYATLEKKVDHWEDRNLLLEASQAHKVIVGLVEDLQNTSAELEEYQGIILLLNRLMTWHIEQEEDALYDMAYRYLDYDHFSALAKRMQEVQHERLEQAKVEARRSNRVPSRMDRREQKAKHMRSR